MSDDAKARGVQGFIGGALVVGTIAVGVFLSAQPAQPTTSPAPRPMPAPPSFAAAPSAPADSPEAQSPLGVADQLFNEAMMASEQHDQETLTRVLPGALMAYRSLGELDDDRTYHVAVLELVGGKLTEARATCATLLAKNPKHLLALGVSLQAAVKAGDAAAARDFAQRSLQAYEAESVRPLAEYQEHERMLPTYRAEAMAAVK